MMEELSHNDLMPMNYLKIFFRRKQWVIIPTFIGLVAGICTGMLLPKEYVSSTILLVEEGKSDNPLFTDIAVATSVGQRLGNIKESMLGWNSLVLLVKRLNLAKNVKTPQDLEKLILGIRGNMNIKMRGRNIIDLSYTDKDPQEAQSVVKTISEIFIERNINSQQQETSDAIVFIEEQLKVYRGKIKSAEIAQLKDNLKALLVDSTEEHPQVKQLREQIKVKETELKKENLEYTENAQIDASSTGPLIQEIKKALDNVDGGVSTIGVGAKESVDNDIYKVMLMDKLDNVKARDVNVNNTIYNMLLQRLETAKITQRLQTSREGTKYTVVDPPRVPFKPVKPNKLLIAFAGLVLGLMLGAGFVFSFEFLDKSFIDVEEAKNFLGQPLLGAISKIYTEESIRMNKEKAIWLYSLVIVAGIAAILLTGALMNFLS